MDVSRALEDYMTNMKNDMFPYCSDEHLMKCIYDAKRNGESSIYFIFTPLMYFDDKQKGEQFIEKSKSDPTARMISQDQILMLRRNGYIADQANIYSTKVYL